MPGNAKSTAKLDFKVVVGRRTRRHVAVTHHFAVAGTRTGPEKKKEIIMKMVEMARSTSTRLKGHMITL